MEADCLKFQNVTFYHLHISFGKRGLNKYMNPSHISREVNMEALTLTFTGLFTRIHVGGNNKKQKRKKN